MHRNPTTSAVVSKLFTQMIFINAKTLQVYIYKCLEILTMHFNLVDRGDDLGGLQQSLEIGDAPV